MLKATTKNELSSALNKEYGNAHGNLIYNHIKSIFTKMNDTKNVDEDSKLNGNQ